jgi:hypothetical protein
MLYLRINNSITKSVLQKPTAARPAMKLPAFYGIIYFITVYTRPTSEPQSQRAESSERSENWSVTKIIVVMTRTPKIKLSSLFIEVLLQKPHDRLQRQHKYKQTTASFEKRPKSWGGGRERATRTEPSVFWVIRWR